MAETAGVHTTASCIDLTLPASSINLVATPSFQPRPSAMTGSSSSQDRDSSAKGKSTGHAHHLKFGDIDTAGFGTIDDLEHEHRRFEADHVHGSPDEATSRQKRKIVHERTVEVLDAESRRIHDKRRYLFRKPRALQYFRGKTLIRSDEERSSSRLELFFDLTFVGLASVGGEEVSADPTGASLVRFLLTFAAAFLIWSWMREIFNAFYRDDLESRTMVLFVMACLMVFGNNSTKVELRDEPGGNARAATIGSYLLAELCIFAHFVFYSFHIKAYRIQLLSHTGVWLLTTGIWIGAIFVSTRAAAAMATVALVIEYLGWCIVYSPPFKRLLKLRYSSATNIEHELERHADFITLVTGEFVASAFKGQPAGIGFHDRTGRAIMSLMVAWAFQLLYINGGGSLKIIHPIRHSMFTVFVFFSAHIPIVAAMTICGDGMGEMIKEKEAASGLRWLVCESYAVTMLGLWVLAAIEVEQDDKGELWMPKWLRIFPRLVATVIAVFIPFTYEVPPPPEESSAEQFRLRELLGRAEEHVKGGSSTIQKHGDNLDTTKLMAILTTLAVLCLLWETVGGLQGPAAPDESAPQHLIDLASGELGDGHNTAVALQTPKWKGIPTFAEPGSFSFDYSRQRGAPPLADDAVAHRQEDIMIEGEEDLHDHPEGTHLHPSKPNAYSDGPERRAAGPMDPAEAADSPWDSRSSDSDSGPRIGPQGSVHVGNKAATAGR